VTITRDLLAGPVGQFARRAHSAAHVRRAVKTVGHARNARR
jgi:hypothetical protein